MTLYIGFVDPKVSVEYMTAAFNDTYDADVHIEFGPTKKNRYGISYKTAKVYNSSVSHEMNHFISEIKKHGNNRFNHNKVDSWNVHMEQTPAFIPCARIEY